MNKDLKAIEKLFLWRLAVAGGGDWKKDLKPDLEAPARNRLETAGLIEKEKRKPPSGRGTLLFISLTDQGWGWLSENLDSELNTTSTAGNGILQRLLGKLKTYIDKANISLGDLMTPPGESTAGGAVDLDERIAGAYETISNGRTNVRVRLSELRASLPSVSRKEFDEALLRLASDGKASLYRLDNPAEIRAEDREAVLLTPSGEERHIVYLGGRSS